MWTCFVILTLTAQTPPQFGLGTGDTAPQQTPRPRPRPQPAPELACTATPPDRACTTDADCTLVRTIRDCCGTIAELGINRADVARFSDQERRCNPGRRCGCASGPTVLDEGRVRGNELVVVSCKQQLCTSSAMKLTSDSVQSLPACDASQCGPAPAYPTSTCPDGVHQSGRGPCVRVNDRCAWARMTCP